MKSNKLNFLIVLSFVLIALSLSQPAAAHRATDYISSGIQCRAAGDPCVDSRYGRNLVVYSDDATTQKFLVNGTNGNTTIAGTLAVTGTISGGAEGTIAYTRIMTATIAQLNANSGAGTVIVTVPSGRSFRLLNFKAIAYGAACTTTTTVDLDSGSSSTKLVTFAQANLTRSNVLVVNSTGATVLADGASYLPQPLGQNILVARTGSDVAGCTGVIFIIDYALE